MLSRGYFGALGSYRPAAKVSSALCRRRGGFQEKQLLWCKAGATERHPAAGTRCPPPPGCQIRPGQEHGSCGDSPAPLLCLLRALNPLCRHSPPAHGPAAEGAAGFGPLRLFSGEGRRVLPCGQCWEDDGVPRAHLLLGKKLHLVQKMLLMAPTRHPESDSSPAPRVYGFYYQPRELTATGRAWPGLGDCCHRWRLFGRTAALPSSALPEGDPKIPAALWVPPPGRSRVPWK